jgi:hypothetical protein
MDILEELLQSESFLNWSPDANHVAEPIEPITLGQGRSFLYKGKTYTNLLVIDEKHFAPADLAKAWGLSAEKIRQLFRAEPGVLRIGDGYVTLRIPQSVAVRVHTRLTAIPQMR